MKITIKETSVCFCELDDEIIEKEFSEWMGVSYDEDELEELDETEMGCARNEFLSEYIHEHYMELIKAGRYVDGDLDWWRRK